MDDIRIASATPYGAYLSDRQLAAANRKRERRVKPEENEENPDEPEDYYEPSER